MPAIEVQNVNKSYGDHAVLRDVSITVEKGEIFGLIGPNGAGKTTLVECIAGLRQPDNGQIYIKGLDPRKDLSALRRILGIQLQDSQLPDKIKAWKALDLYSSFQRELEILRLVAAGTTNREIARALFISEATVKTHLLHIFEKLGVPDRAAAVSAANQQGYLQAE